jgi:hypothetical protein
MAKICYQDKNFRQHSHELIQLCNTIIADFQGQGFDLTLRQLYYQLVSRAVIPNNERSYDNIGALINDARLAGLIDWDAIVDRTRNLRALPHWNDPSEIISSAAKQFNFDRWVDQGQRIEVWIEKDALVGVIGKICESLDVPYFSCRGYTSQSEMWIAAMRIVKYQEQNQEVTILHLGDHDPSGLDMTRDITDRLAMFCEYHNKVAPTVLRIALNMDQIHKYNPPPNPAKISDSRASAYIAEHGDESWELDALEPKVIVGLIRKNIYARMDRSEFEEATEREEEAREELSQISDNYADIVKRRKP